MKEKAYRLVIKGIVQGVGFRPHVYRLAVQCGLKGWVMNSSAGVFVEIEGPEDRVDEFVYRIINEPPPLALIRSYEVDEIGLSNFQAFSIRESENRDANMVMISPDIAICEECKQEVKDPGDRRYAYPFTNCTNCGPRFTIIKDIPYDRAKTTMADFSMCPLCSQEYHNPLHRRFHAQPNACPVCGPQVTLVDRNNKPVEGSTINLLKQGYIIAVKGLGGFHLAADARNTGSVKALRQRKQRDAKPFAVMARDLKAARIYCEINSTEEQMLASARAPIVVLRRKEDSGLPAELIHPGLDTLGVMLPYTPLHYLLFDDDLDLLIMTSANISDDPLITGNEAALSKLSGIADFFLLHNREIYNPCDDSVLKITPMNTPQLLRRARGYVPQAIRIPVRPDRPVLAVGGEMKNTFCITREQEAYLSQHWGDLNHYLNYLNFQKGMERFKKMLDVEPEILAHDLHPDYQTTRWAREQTGYRKIAVQHHHAHMAAVMGENGLEGEVLGLICDGTGWGTDGAVWGCEILRGDYRQFTRPGHLQYIPLPGGDLTVKKPYRMAFAYLYTLLGDRAAKVADKYLPDLSVEERDILINRLERKKDLLLTSSCGRLFDAAAALLGICTLNRYDGQAAIELEARAKYSGQRIYSYSIEKTGENWLMDILPAWAEMVIDLDRDMPAAEIAGKFHLTVAAMMADTLVKIGKESNLNRIVLSGGVLHNDIILVELMKKLKHNGFEVFQHLHLPPGDGGISLGQAIIASEVFKDVSGSSGQNN